MAETTTQRLNPERDVALLEGKIKYNESYDEFPLLLTDQPKRLNELAQCKHEWHEEERRGLRGSVFFCAKCDVEMR